VKEEISNLVWFINYRRQTIHEDCGSDYQATIWQSSLSSRSNFNVGLFYYVSGNIFRSLHYIIFL